MRILPRKDGFEEMPKIGPVLDDTVTHHSYQNGIEVRVKSLQK